MDKSKWTYKKLGEVCELYQPKTISSKELIKDGEYPVYGANGVIGRYNKYNHEHSEILMTCRGATCGVINISQPRSWINGNAMVVHPNNGSISPNFLAYYLNYTDKSNIITGVAQPQITRQNLKELAVAIPPISDQQQIVSELDQLSELISLKQQQLREYNALTLSLFYEMFLKQDSNWPTKTIGELATDVKYGTSKAGGTEGKYKYLRMNNLTDDGHLDLSDLKYIDLSDDEPEKYVVRKGDVLFNRTNSREKVGKTALYWEDEEMVIAGYIIRVRLKEEANPVYLVKYMNTPYMKRVLRKLAKGAVGQANINAQQMQTIQVPVPPIELQNVYADRIEAIEQQKFMVSQSIAEAQTLLNSRMQEYFG